MNKIFIAALSIAIGGASSAQSAGIQPYCKPGSSGVYECWGDAKIYHPTGNNCGVYIDKLEVRFNAAALLCRSTAIQITKLWPSYRQPAGLNHDKAQASVDRLKKTVSSGTAHCVSFTYKPMQPVCGVSNDNPNNPPRLIPPSNDDGPAKTPIVPPPISNDDPL